MTHVSNGKESFIKEQHHAKEEEEHTEPRQPHSDLWRFHGRETINYALFGHFGL